MIGRWKENKDVIPCSEKVEPGYFFGPGGGSIMVITKIFGYLTELSVFSLFCTYNYSNICFYRFIDNSVLDLILTLL